MWYVKIGYHTQTVLKIRSIFWVNSVHRCYLLVVVEKERCMEYEQQNQKMARTVDLSVVP